MVGTFFSYRIIKERYFKDSDGGETKGAEQVETPQTAESPKGESVTQSETEAEDSQIQKKDFEEEEGEEKTDEYLEIEKDDCQNNCKAFKDDKEELKYCQQICGLAAPKEQGTDKDGCEKYSGLEEDYCLKDLALESKDFSLCDKISDKNIKKSCANSLTEYFMDQFPSQSE